MARELTTEDHREVEDEPASLAPAFAATSLSEAAARGVRRGRAGLTARLERDLSGALRWRLADRSISRRKPGVATRRARDARENAAVRMDAAGATADAAAIDPRRVGAGNRAGRIASVARCGEGRRRTGARAGLTTRARTRADARGDAVDPRRVVVARCPIFGVAIALAALATLAIARSPLHAPAHRRRTLGRRRGSGLAVHAECPAG